MDSENPTTDLLNILSKAMDSKVYGSIEVYLEDGQITQISQRVIKKIRKTATTKHIIKLRRGASQARKVDSVNNTSLKFRTD